MAGVVAVYDTAAARRERAEAVARAISCCKNTLHRRSSSSSMPPPPPPPSPSPSLDDWLDDRDRQQEVKIIGSAAEQHSRPLPTRPRRDWETRAKKRFKELPCPAAPASPSQEDYGSLAATAVVVHGEESPHHAHGWRGESMNRSLDELEFLKTFDGDEEMINRHFITVEIPRSGSQVFTK